MFVAVTHSHAEIKKKIKNIDLGFSAFFSFIKILNKNYGQILTWDNALVYHTKCCLAWRTTAFSQVVRARRGSSRGNLHSGRTGDSIREVETWRLAPLGEKQLTRLSSETQTIISNYILSVLRTTPLFNMIHTLISYNGQKIKEAHPFIIGLTREKCLIFFSSN